MLETFPKKMKQNLKILKLITSITQKLKLEPIKIKGTFNTVFRDNNETFPKEIYLASKSSL